MTDSDVTAVNPRDGAAKTGRMDDTSQPYPVTEPKIEPEVSPGPDTREEPNSPK